jgi:FAD/FMN-containing dehydrogenase
VSRAAIAAAGVAVLGLLGCGAAETAPGAAAAPPAAPATPASPGFDVSDLHARLNPVHVAQIERPASLADVQAAVKRAKDQGLAVSIMGTRHAMGGQPFGAGTILLDMTAMHRVLRLDRERALVEAEAGVTWPDLLDFLHANQAESEGVKTIRQKQAGADRMTLGGALGANAHGRGLKLKPIADDVDSFILVDADGVAMRCSRAERPDVFRLAIGGYGLFGVIATVTLRLVPRERLEHDVEVVDAPGLMAAFDKRVAAGFLYGECRLAIDPASEDFLRRGILSAWRRMPPSHAPMQPPRELSHDAWRELMVLAHTDPSKWFAGWRDFEVATQKENIWSDDAQMDTYLEAYHDIVDARTGAKEPGGDLPDELCVPPAGLAAFLDEARAWMRTEKVRPVDAVVRLIEKDDQTFFSWAARRSACVTISQHLERTPAGIEQAAQRGRHLIDLALKHGGTFFPGYGRDATPQQMEAAFPMFREFLSRKVQYDREERFQSEWYRFYKKAIPAS